MSMNEPKRVNCLGSTYDRGARTLLAGTVGEGQFRVALPLPISAEVKFSYPR